MDLIVPQAVVVDTRDGYTFWRGSNGRAFTLETAREFAEVRNQDRGPGEFGFRVFTLTEDREYLCGRYYRDSGGEG